MARSTKTKPNMKVLIPGGLLLLPPGFIVFQGIRDLALIPAPIALFTIAGLVAIAVILVFQGLRNIQEGDIKDARIQFGLAGLVLVAEIVGQVGFAIALDHPLVTALIFAMLSIGGGVIIESEIMRVWRANARQDGLMSLARPQVPHEVKKFYPEVAAFADRLAVRFPNATQESVLDMAFAEHDRMTAEPAPVQVRVDVRSLGGRPAVAAQSPSAHQAITAQVSDVAGPPASIASQVRAAMADGASDYDAVAEAVLAANPAANPATIRRCWATASKTA